MNTVFVSFPFGGSFDGVFEVVRQVAVRHHFTAIRVDEDSMLATPVRDSILRGIREAKLVIADITGANANVLHEIGLAQALGKPLVLLTQEQPEKAPFNVRGLKVVRYDLANLDSLAEYLGRALTEETSPNELLRAMLVPSTLGRPNRDSRFVIAASPLSFRRSKGRSGGYKQLRRTAADYVGIRGILQGFGLLFDFDVLPDLLDPDDFDDQVLQGAMNIYCVASPKANRWTRGILDEYGARWAPRLAFRADPASDDVRSVALSIFCDEGVLQPPGWTINGPGDRTARDFGLIVRGPNPWHQEQMAVVIAGRSALGTEAASIAFTDPNAVANIQNRLAPLKVSLDDHRAPFWVVVSIEKAIGDGREEAVRETLRIEDVQVLGKRR